MISFLLWFPDCFVLPYFISIFSSLLPDLCISSFSNSHKDNHLAKTLYTVPTIICPSLFEHYFNTFGYFSYCFMVSILFFYCIKCVLKITYKINLKFGMALFMSVSISVYFSWTMPGNINYVADPAPDMNCLLYLTVRTVPWSQSRQGAS